MQHVKVIVRRKMGNQSQISDCQKNTAARRWPWPCI
jgi:hypothetical protein